MTAPVPQAVQLCHELLLWLIPQLDKFPRVRRFTLGERLERALLEVLELLVEAAYTKAKAPALRRANLRLEVGRHLWRLCHELKAVSTRRWEHGGSAFARRAGCPGRRLGAAQEGIRVR